MTDYGLLGYDTFLNKDLSLLNGMNSIQFYQTTNVDSNGNAILNGVGSGLATIDTTGLSQSEINTLLNSLSSEGISQPINVVAGHIQSANFLTGSKGWRIDSDGNLEANDGYFRGDLTGATGTFSGTVSVGSLNIPNAVTANSFHVDSSGNAWWGATTLAGAIAKILNTGAATFTNVVITGVQAGSSINGAYIQSLTITGDKLVNATVTGDKIDNATITGSNIANGTISGSNIGSGTITGTNIGTGTITGANIDSATITGSNIDAATITAANIVNGTITATQISGTAGITGSQIANGTITSDNITNATITASDIANSTITSSQIANATITSTQIATGTITANNIAAATITGTEIQNGTITAVEIANQTIIATNIANGAITTTQINATAGITGTQIANSTITGDNISNNTITIGKASLPTHIISGSFVDNSPSSGRVRWEGVTVDYNGTTYPIDDDNTLNKYIYWDYSVTTIKFQTSSTIPTLENEDCLVATNTSGIHKLIWNATDVSGDMIQLAAITGSNIASSTITGSNIATNTIEGSNINSATITGSNIANNTITGGNLVNNTITATQISNGTITGTQIAGSTITGDNIANNTITGTNITSATITGSNVASNTIAGSNIINNTITATQIQNATITSTQIANATITGSNIASTTITASNIANGTITATQIQALSITASEIANLTITSDKISSVTVDKLAAGTITSKTISLAVAAGTGDVYIAAGKTDFTNDDNGFILGIDDSDSDKAKFYIGDSSQYLNWNGNSLIISGKSSLTGISIEAGEDLTAGETVYFKKNDSKLYKTTALYNSEEIHEFKGIVQTTTSSGSDATLINSGVVSGLSFSYTGTVTSTLDWSQTTTTGTYGLGYQSTYGDLYQRFCTGDFVNNITSVQLYIKTKYGDGNDLSVGVYEVDNDGVQMGSALTTFTLAKESVSTSAWNTLTGSAAVLQPRKMYVLGITRNNNSTHYFSVGSSATSKNGGGIYGVSDPPSLTGWALNDNVAIKTYYTATSWCNVGDNVYLSDTPGDIDYIPGTYQKAIGMIISQTEILMPYESGKPIGKYGMIFNTGGSSALPIPRNAKTAIIQGYLYRVTSADELAGEITLINPIKMSGEIRGAWIGSPAGNESISVTWSGNYITFTFFGMDTAPNAQACYIYATFIT